VGDFLGRGEFEPQRSKCYSQLKGVMAMAKNQRRGNREVKKPKKATSVSASSPSAGSPWLTVDKLNAQDRNKKIT
jgi:hypothetical protein